MIYVYLIGKIEDVVKSRELREHIGKMNKKVFEQMYSLKIMKEKPVLYHRFTNYVELLLISLSENDVSTPKLVDNEETRLYKKAINSI